MILACPACDGRYDVTGHPVGQQFRCRCGEVITLEALSPQAGMLACPHCGAGVPPTSHHCGHCAHALLLKGCPRRLSRVFHGHKHCPECGAELSVVATVETATLRECPRCDQQLGARRIDDIVVDECIACHGLFIDHVAIQRLVTDRRQARAESLLGALPRTTTYELQPAGKMYIKCPICAVIINRKLRSSRCSARCGVAELRALPDAARRGPRRGPRRDRYRITGGSWSLGGGAGGSWGWLVGSVGAPVGPTGGQLGAA